MLLRMCGEGLSHGFSDCGPGSLSSFADMEPKNPFETLSLVGLSLLEGFAYELLRYLCSPEPLKNPKDGASPQ